MFISIFAISLIPVAVVMDPFILHRLLPSVLRSRYSINIPSSTSMPFSSSIFNISGLSIVNIASTTAFFSPLRIMDLLVRSPNTILIESMIIDLPAPVSPVSTLKPLLNSISASSMTAMFFMCNRSSIIYILYLIS